MSETPVPLPISKLLLPPDALAACLFAGIYRDTRGVPLSDADRINHFPASPLVSVSYVIHGALRDISAVKRPPGMTMGTAFPRCFAMGPSDAPVSSWSPQEVTAITIGIYHDAWLRIGGDPDFQAVPGWIETALARFGTAPEPRQGWESLCAAFEQIWRDARPAGWRKLGGIADWAQAATTRAALSGAGRSLRSIERRLKQTSGQNQRALNFYAAFENLHHTVQRHPESTLAEIALEAGYSDQSHMGRAVRRATGFSPARLNKAIQTDEAFWCYRLLGERL